MCMCVCGVYVCGVYVCVCMCVCVCVCVCVTERDIFKFVLRQWSVEVKQTRVVPRCFEPFLEWEQYCILLCCVLVLLNTTILVVLTCVFSKVHD